SERLSFSSGVPLQRTERPQMNSERSTTPSPLMSSMWKRRSGNARALGDLKANCSSRSRHLWKVGLSTLPFLLISLNTLYRFPTSTSLTVVFFYFFIFIYFIYFLLLFLSLYSSLNLVFLFFFCLKGDKKEKREKE